MVVLGLGDHIEVRCHACIGGTLVRDNIDKLRRGQHIMICTPGPVFDVSSKCLLRIDDLVTFACDEADDMLSRDFQGSDRRHLQNVPSKCSSVFVLCLGASESASQREVHARRCAHQHFCKR